MTCWLRTMTVVADGCQESGAVPRQRQWVSQVKDGNPCCVSWREGKRSVFTQDLRGSWSPWEKGHCIPCTWYVWPCFQLVGCWSPGMEREGTADTQREGGSRNLFLLTLWLPLERMVLKHSVSPRNCHSHGSDHSTWHQQWYYKCYLCLFKPVPTLFPPPPCSAQVTALHTLSLEEVILKG